MAKVKIQNYPRRDDYLAKDKLFPRPKEKISAIQLSQAIARAFERCLKDKQGNATEVKQTPEDLVEVCLQHLKQRSQFIRGKDAIQKLLTYDVKQFHGSPSHPLRQVTPMQAKMGGTGPEHRLSFRWET